VRAVTYNSIISKPSEIVKSITKPLPAEITNLEATNNLPKKINVSWDESKVEDFSHYNLYRSKTIDGGYTLLTETKKTKYEDILQEDGEKYFYRVSAVDRDGLESIHDRNSASGMSLPKPLAPSVVEARLIENKKVVLEWKKNDPKVTSYIVRKKYSKGLFDTALDEYKDIKGTTFEDSKIEPSQTYYYQVLSVDKYSIESKPSMEVVIETKEIKKEEDIK
jgi:fibronectin type 3 domain-containing protein